MTQPVPMHDLEKSRRPILGTLRRASPAKAARGVLAGGCGKDNISFFEHEFTG
jgi:hypothetical protein